MPRASLQQGIHMLHQHHLCKSLLILSCFFLVFFKALNAHGQHIHQHDDAATARPVELGLSAAFDRQGNVWAVSKDTAADGSAFLALRRSADMGKSWSSPQVVTREAIAARGEERPKLAFGPKGELYIVYTRPASGFRNPHIGDIRFTRSLDDGKTFSEPVTIHANRDVIVHSFGTLILDKKGNIYIIWIDNRDKEHTRSQQQAYAGNAIYYAVSQDGGQTFKGDFKIADHTCECCRISLSLAPGGNPVAMWRHIFGADVRDHALAELNPEGQAGKIVRATFDEWKVEACPHHGPSIAYGPNGVRHQVWFNGRDDEKGGVLYAAFEAQGKSGTPVPLGSAQASHADVAVQDNRLAIVWKQFDGKSTAILGKTSNDNGLTWSEQILARTSGDSDKPYLVQAPSGIVLVWHTKNEGIRIVPVSNAS
jgi:hypothetical protein